MPTLRVELDRETYDCLLRQAEAERRPVPWQAEVAIRRSLGLPFPSERPMDGRSAVPSALPPWERA